MTEMLKNSGSSGGSSQDAISLEGYVPVFKYRGALSKGDVDAIEILDSEEEDNEDDMDPLSMLAKTHKRRKRGSKKPEKKE